MKIELKKKKVCKWASEETICFQAELWIDGKNCGMVSNDGKGGAHRFDMSKEFRPTLAQAEAYCKTLPPVKCESFTLPMDLELYISMAI